MKKWFFIFLLIVLSISVQGRTSYNFLTKGYADSLYCTQDSNCSFITNNITNIFNGGQIPTSPWIYNDTTNLYWNETKGNETTREVIKNITEKQNQSISRALLIDHSAISILQGNIGKFYDLLRLAAYIKDIESNK